MTSEENQSTPKFYFLATSDRFIPTNDGRSVGWDVCADIGSPMQICAGQSLLIPLGIKVICPEGWWLQLNPRSSTFAKKDLVSLVGVIDTDYEGNIMLACKYLPTDKLSVLTIQPGEKIAQLIPMELKKMHAVQVSQEEFAQMSAKRNASRGAGGFGSTGN